MSVIEVRTVGDTEAPAAITAIVVGFVADPVARWCWPKPRDYLQYMPRFASTYGGKAFQSDSAYVVGEASGAALWLPPDVHPDEDQLGELMSETVASEKQGDFFESLEQLSGYRPGEPHWFLPLIAVDAAFQGRGLGSALMQAAVQKCDEDGVVAYLESSNPLNITLYERHGFRAVGEVQVGDAPTFTPMIRDPR